MGRGNCNVNTGIGEKVYYVDNDLLQLYYEKANPEHIVFGKELTIENSSQYEYDQDESQQFFDDTINNIKTQLMKKFKSLKETNHWNGRRKHVILESDSFEIALEDNEWSIAFELLMKPDGNAGLKKNNAKSFGKGLRDILLDNFEKIYIRTSAWTCGKVTKESAKQSDIEDKNNKKYQKEHETETNNTEDTQTANKKKT